MNLRINGQFDPIAAGAQFVFHGITVGRGVLQPVQLQQNIHHFGNGIFHIVRISIHTGTFAGVFFKHRRRRWIQCFLILFVGDKLIFIHAAKHVICPVVGDGCIVHTFLGAGVEVPPRIIIVGTVGGSGQHGAFTEGQFAQAFAEVALCRHLHAIVIFTQENGIQIAFQNLLFGILLLQLHSQISFLDFSLIALFRGEQRVFDQLLGNGRTALGAGGRQVGHKGTHNTLDVYAVMGIEPCILHGDKRLLKVRRHGRKADADTIFRALVFRNQITVRIINKRGLCLIIQGRQV